MGPIAINSLEPTEVFPGVHKRSLHCRFMTLTEYRFAPLARFPDHVHPQEQLSMVVEGEAIFIVAGAGHRTRTGEAMLIEPSAVHSVTAGSEGARVLSVVSPSRSGGESILILED